MAHKNVTTWQLNKESNKPRSPLTEIKYPQRKRYRRGVIHEEPTSIKKYNFLKDLFVDVYLYVILCYRCYWLYYTPWESWECKSKCETRLYADRNTSSHLSSFLYVACIHWSEMFLQNHNATHHFFFLPQEKNMYTHYPIY